MASTEMTTGITERVLYGVLLGGAMKAVEKGWISADMAPYIAGGALTLIGGAWAWWLNRPGRLMDAAAAQMPPNAKLTITMPVHASAQDKDAAHDLARSAGENVVAKVQV